MKRMLLALLPALTAACTSLPITDVPSRNQDSRIHFLVLHFTSEHFAESMRLLTGQDGSPVSVHYVVPEPGDESYDRNSLRVFRLVPEANRARHAGVSYWGGLYFLNDTSIGIEIVNRSACTSSNPDAPEPKPEDQSCEFLRFPDEQIDLVIRLAKDILERHPDIDPVDVIGHADIAPLRRLDPGPLFPWRQLYEHGIGAWYEEASAVRYLQQFEADPPTTQLVQLGLAAYGYQLEATGEEDTHTRFVVRAFQMHFRPDDYSGRIDAETAAVLFALLEKYRPEALAALLQDVTY